MASNEEYINRLKSFHTVDEIVDGYDKHYKNVDTLYNTSKCQSVLITRTQWETLVNFIKNNR